MSDIRYAEFLASLETTKYPFIPTASLSNGEVSFLEGTFLDAHIYPIGGSGRYYISQVTVTSTSFTLFVGDNTNAQLLSSTVTLPITTESLRLTDVYGRPGGILVSSIERLSLMSAWGLGIHTFEQKQTEFCVTCEMPVPDPGVTGFRLPSGEILTGRVWLVGSDGVILHVEPSTTDKNGNLLHIIRIDVVGDPLFLQRLCSDASLFTPVNPIRKLNIVNGNTVYTCSPDAHGNFSLQMNDALAPDAALRVRTTVDGIVINVEGSTPLTGQQ